MITEPVVVELDDRGRASLGKLADRRTYLARREPDGVIVLEPASVVTETELKLLRNPELVAKIRAAIDDPSRLVRRGRPRRREGQSPTRATGATVRADG